MTRLPIPGNDNGHWGTILNDFLAVEHDIDGTLKNIARPSELATKVAKGELVVNVKDYGAIGNGTVDDTIAINSALTAGQTLGRAVVFAAGETYKITAALTDITAPLTVTGNGATIRQVTASAGVFAITASHVTIDDLRLIGPGGGNSDGAQPKAIYAHGATWAARISNIRVTRCHIQGFKFYGVYTLYVERLRVQSCTIDDMWHAGVMMLSCADSIVDDNDISNIHNTFNAYGVAASRMEAGTTLTTDPRCIDIAITNNRVSGIPSWEGLDTHAGQRITFIGNIVTGCKTGIAVGSSDDTTNSLSWYAPLDCVVANNIIDSGVTDGTSAVGIGFTGALDSGERATGVISGNTIKWYGGESNANQGGIYLHDTNGLSVVGNTIINPSPVGIVAYFTNRGFSITGNTIIDPWTNTVGVGEAIAIKVSSTNNTGVIAGNSFIRGDLTGKTVILDKGMRFPNLSGISIALGTNRSSATTYMIDNSSAGSVYSMTGGIETYSGVGSPAGILTARTGASYLNVSGGAGTTMYLKESGSGNTGWTPVPGLSSTTPAAAVVGGAGVVGTSTTAARSDHVHALPAFGTTAGTFVQGNDVRFASIAGPDMPADRGFLAWTMPVYAAISGGSLATAGTLYLVRVRRVPMGNITNISVFVTVAGSVLTAGQCFASLFTSAGVLIGSTTDQAANWSGTTGLKTMALSGGPFANVDTDLYVGFWFNGTTGPQFARNTNASAALFNLGLSAPNLQAATANTGLTTTAPGTFGTQTSFDRYFWVALS